MGRRQKQGATAVGCAILLGLAAPVLAQSSGASIVDEALKGVQADQARDAERVRRMVDEAVKGTEGAPSGLEAVNPPAPAELQPLPDDTPGALPAGYRPEDLAGKPVRDGTSTEIGRIRALVLDQTSGAARAMVAFTPLFGQPGKISAVEVESLVPSSRGDGFELQLTPVQLEQMPAYALDQQIWRRIDG